MHLSPSPSQAQDSGCAPLTCACTTGTGKMLTSNQKICLPDGKLIHKGELDIPEFGVHSEVGRLRKVIVHRPGLEMKRLTPTNAEELLFDDVIWAHKARQDHDAFVDLMRAEFGIQVMRVHELLKDVVDDPEGWAYLLDRRVVPNEVGPGGAIGICGSTGAGKSTLINILTRYYDIDSGTILIDGQNLSKLTQDSLRKQVGVVLQEAFLFTDTVMNNLKYAREGATEEECIEAVKEANAHQFIMNLPQGYDTMLTKRGANLSQSQRQMITIARAMVAQPKIMILDEATSNVDTRTEKLIQEGLRKLMEGKTSFSIAHRLATIRDSAKIMVLNGGEIVEYASHDELMAAKGFYYALYMSQFKGKAPGFAKLADVDFVST